MFQIWRCTQRWIEKCLQMSRKYTLYAYNKKTDVHQFLARKDIVKKNSDEFCIFFLHNLCMSPTDHIRFLVFIILYFNMKDTMVKAESNFKSNLILIKFSEQVLYNKLVVNHPIFKTQLFLRSSLMWIRIIRIIMQLVLRVFY